MTTRDEKLAALYARCRTGSGVVDLSARVKLRLTGADRVRYLNGQVTCDVRKLSPREGTPACVLTAKGKLCGEVLITATSDALYLDGDASLREALPARLERYIVADDVTLEDVSDELRLIHCLGEPAGEVAASLTSKADRFGRSGTDLLVPVGEFDATWKVLTETQPEITEALAETLRIEAARPRWSHELDENTLPPEAGLERTHIDYHKGCYIGQEVISRLKSIGHVNRALTGFTAPEDSQFAAGMQLFSSDDPEKARGVLTSVCWSFALEKPIALGYLRRGSPAEGLNARYADASAPAIPVHIHELPFTS